MPENLICLIVHFRANARKKCFRRHFFPASHTHRGWLHGQSRVEPSANRNETEKPEANLFARSEPPPGLQADPPHATLQRPWPATSGDSDRGSRAAIGIHERSNGGGKAPGVPHTAERPFRVLDPALCLRRLSAEHSTDLPDCPENGVFSCSVSGRMISFVLKLWVQSLRDANTSYLAWRLDFGQRLFRRGARSCREAIVLWRPDSFGTEHPVSIASQ